MRTIPLTKGRSTVVDDADYETLTVRRWHLHPKGYAAASVQADNIQRSILMHREILCPAQGLQVDHINGDRLDNRRENLRVVTAAQNRRNTRKGDGKTSRFKGVHRNNDGVRWNSEITVDYKSIRLGVFKSEIDAAATYDQHASRFFGEFARLNFPIHAPSPSPLSNSL